ncbi:50S ribosomal protein L44e [Candidatus Woesearchaeota archaeon]|nr:50S ribosomal protein L44e [Candidatus Woesearchaeota archaeon]MCF7901194.1 50S ribosomal protein L44e [Candidatus Woesearchaeota archaeon]MCF8013711.1 50S ribosomal protein L44e [Candidatus Woesearchaeota archaeon]
MKVPKSIKRHCPKCNKHTEQKVTESKNKGRSKSHPLSRFGSRRLTDRGERTGVGNHGKFSKPAIKSWRRTGKKLSKKTDLRYSCAVCKKMSVQSEGKRAKKLELI